MIMSSFHFPSKVLNLVDIRPKDHEVKGAVKLDPLLKAYLPKEFTEDGAHAHNQTGANSFPSATTTFATFNKREEHLADFVAKLAAQLVPSFSAGHDQQQPHFALMFDDRRSFVTEESKQTLQQGFILIFTASPDNYARHFLSGLDFGGPSLSPDQLSMLGSLSRDQAFVEAFQRQRGIQRLASVIEESADWHPFWGNGSDSLLLALLHSLLHQMHHFPQLVPWSALSTQFVKKIAFFVNGQSKLEQNDSRALALDMLFALAEHCGQPQQECLRQEVSVDSLIRHLDNPDQRVLLGSLALIISLYTLADREERLGIVKTLHGRPFIAAICHVLERYSVTATGPAEQSDLRIQLRDLLSKIQQIRFDEVRALALRAPSEREIDFVMALDEFGYGFFTNRHFGAGAENNGQCYPIDVKRNERAAEEMYINAPFQMNQRGMDGLKADWHTFRQFVQETPPGSLATCAILNLTRPGPSNIPQQQMGQLLAADRTWTKLLEVVDARMAGRQSQLPFLLARLAKLLIQVLGICEVPSVPLGKRSGQSVPLRFWRLVLKCERPFYDLFHTLVDLFARTWRDMNAKHEELDKVFNVVQDQLQRAMAEDPDSLEQLEGEFLWKRFSYFNMQKLWKREQLEQQSLELNSKDIQPLCEYLRPNIERIVLDRRINFLKKGLIFQRMSSTTTIAAARQQKGESQQYSSHSPAAFSSSTAVHSSPVFAANYSPSNVHLQFQHWFWCLDQRERHFNFWECHLVGGKQPEKMSDTIGKLPVSQIHSLVHGQELLARLSSHQHSGFKMAKKGQNSLRFGLCLETANSSDEFILFAQNEAELAAWMDGLNCLCWPREALKCAPIEAEVERLLKLEVQIRMLDVPLNKGEKLELPKLPDNFSWVPVTAALA